MHLNVLSGDIGVRNSVIVYVLQSKLDLWPPVRQYEPLANRRALLGNRGLIGDPGSPFANRAPYCLIGKYLGIGVIKTLRVVDHSKYILNLIYLTSLNITLKCRIVYTKTVDSKYILNLIYLTSLNITLKCRIIILHCIC